ncbi:MAG TPA: GDSL-type esterase/lipase family protein [Lentimicrobium sp.]|nr:GDSL-type esterase/lipase family protein [Lentimicrobium sp.]
MSKGLKILIITNILIVFSGGCVTQYGNREKQKNESNAQPKNVDISNSTHYYTKRSFFESMPNDTNEIVFLGNSITEMCDWNELFNVTNIKNRGISGDIINGVIERIDEVVSSEPKKIFIMIGTNDLGRGKSVNQIITEYEVLVELIINKTPQTELYLQSILPTKNQITRKNEDIIEINKGIVEIAKKHSLTYINLYDLFKTKDNELNMNFSFDGLHLNGDGYLLWKDAVINYIKE